MLLVFFQVECFHPLGAQKMYQTELKRDLRLYHKQCMFPVRTSPCSFEKKNAVLSAIRKKQVNIGFFPKTTKPIGSKNRSFKVDLIIIFGSIWVPSNKKMHWRSTSNPIINTRGLYN